MNGSTTTAGTQDHHGGGFANVIAGLEHFPGHVIAALRNESSVLSLIVNSKPAQEVVAYDKTHGKEQVDAIKKAATDKCAAQRAAGADKATAVKAAIVAAFECGVAQVKSLGALAMEFLVTAAVAGLGL